MDMKRAKLDPDRIGQLHSFAEVMCDVGLFRNCLNCSYWLKHNETCDKFKSRPPATVIIVGCEHHTDLIPF